MKPFRYGRVWLAVGIGLLAAVVVLSVAPLPERAGNLPDKLGHALAYAALGGWFGGIFLRSSHLRIAAGLILFGIAIEFVQGLTGYRNFELRDMLADTAGVAIGLLLLSTPLGNGISWLETRLRNG